MHTVEVWASCMSAKDLCMCEFEDVSLFLSKKEMYMSGCISDICQ